MAAVSKRLSIRYLTSLTNYYTSLFQPIFQSAGQSQADAISFFVAALGDGSLAWDEISLEPLAGEAPFFGDFRNALERCKYPYTVNECFANWYYPTDGNSYETYENSLPSKLRHTLQRKQRKLDREVDSTIRIVHDNSDLSEFIHDYAAVYQKSWKSEESYPGFIHAIIESFAQKGWLRLGLMYVDGVPVAAQLWFVKDGIASIYKLAYDGKYAQYSVGTILTAAMMKHVLDVDQVRLVDFLTGDDAYKKDWMSHRQGRYRIRVYNRHTWRGRMLALWNMKIKHLFTAS